MKISRMFSTAALLVASLSVSTAASAQSYGGNRHLSQAQQENSQVRPGEGDRAVSRDDGRYDHGSNRADQNRYNRRDGRSYGNHGRGNGWARQHRHCQTQWHHHHAVTRCW